MQVGSLVEYIGDGNLPGLGKQYRVLPSPPTRGDIATVTKDNGAAILVDEFTIIPIYPRILTDVDGWVKKYWREIQPPMEVSSIVKDAVDNFSPAEIQEYV